jgi:retron-type reverse transcriptase
MPSRRHNTISHGFPDYLRPGRGCHDAIEAIFNTVSGKNPQRRWILDADLAAAFDRIDHNHILAQIGTFPARELVVKWLKSGVIEKGWLTPTEEGTPQGGVNGSSNASANLGRAPRRRHCPC